MHRLISIVFFALLSLQIAAAESMPTTADSLVAEAVVVRGSRTPREVIPVQILSNKQLERLNAYSVADAIRYFSGVQIKDYGGIGGLKTVNVRSLGSQHVGVFYDGIQLGNAQNGIVDLGRFSLDNMESVSLYNGQKSSIFQAARDFSTASSIYLTTRTPRFDTTINNNLSVGMKAGSFATLNPSVLWEHRFSDKLSLSLSTEYLYTSGEYKFRYAKHNGYDTTEIRKNGDVKALRAEVGLFGNISGGEWRAKIYYYNSERGYPGAAVREEPGKFRHQDRQWDENIFVQSSYRKNFKPWYSLLINAKYAYDYLHYKSDPRADVSTMYVDNNYRQQEAYASASNLFSITEYLSFSLSTDLQVNTLNADVLNFVYPTRFSILNAAAASLRFEQFKLQASLLYTFVNDVTKAVGGTTGTRNGLTPTVVASYQPFKKVDFNIRAFYKRVFRMPTLNDLYYTFIGNASLKPEYTNQYNLGATYSIQIPSKIKQHYEIQLDAYYNTVTDKIIAMPTSNQFRWTMVNLGKVQIRGIDLAMQGSWNFGPVELSTRLTYTYQKAQDVTDPESPYYGGQIPYTPTHSGSAIATIGYKGWELNYSFIYTGERYEAVANIPENYAPVWYTNDMSLSKLIQFNNSRYRLRIAAEVNNILNQQYEVVQCYPMPGTNFKIKLNFML